MLVLTRKKGQSIMIQDHIEITVLDVEGDTIKIGIVAPRDVIVMRKELLQSIQEENRESARAHFDMGTMSEELKKIKKNKN